MTLPMRSIFSVALILPAWITLLAGGCSSRDQDTQAGRSGIVVTNSYLQSAVADLMGQTDGDILCINPPGGCPAHFDISASAVKRLSRSAVFIRFDFETAAQGLLKGLIADGLSVRSVKAPQGLSVPSSYTGLCRELCGILTERFPHKKALLEWRLVQIEERLRVLEKDVIRRIEAAGLAGKPVISSRHQEVFCRFAGLDVVGVFAGKDLATAAGIDNVLKVARDKQVRLVVANLQEGTALAQSLAESLGGRCAVLSNFPSGDQSDFYALLEANTGALTLQDSTPPETDAVKGTAAPYPAANDKKPLAEEK